MNELLQIIKEHPIDSTALVSPSLKLSRGELIDRAVELRESAQHLRGLRALVSNSDPVMSIIEMVAFDGFAGTLELVPQGAAQSIDDFQGKVNPISRNDFEFTGETHWLLRTSGTTGTPKEARHTLSTISASLQRNIQVGAGFRWALMYDPCRFAGLQVILQALIGGSTILVPGDENLEDKIDFLVREGCTSISATPSVWRRLLFAKRIQSLPLQHVTLGGEIADQKILDHLRQYFPKAKIRHIYAATELGTIFSVNDGKAGFPCSYLDGGLNNVKLKINADGELCVWRAPNSVDAQYLENTKFVGTGDLVEIIADRVHFVGRTNGVVNIGGHKVSPEKIESIIRGCPGIRDVRVFGLRNSILGQVLAANLVAEVDQNSIDLKAVVQEFCKANLSVVERPSIVRMVREIELTSAGKTDRK
jgi:acyl-CoA synthetase (AMP-forming)/AMP-acid ligase II